jgi:uncharacterized membrane protein
MMPRRTWGIAAILVIAGAFAMRALWLTSKALWFDETVSVLIARYAPAELLATVAANEPHPPLYYLLLHAWIRAFGDGEAALRALSVIIGGLVVVLTWLFGRLLLGAGPALLAALIVAVAPSQVAASQEARMYGLLSATAVASWWSLWAAHSERNPRAWVGYALSVSAMLYTHYYGFFVVAAQGAFMLWRRPRAAAWQGWMRSLAVSAALVAAWVPALIRQLASGRAWPSFRIPLSVPVLVDTFAAMTVGQPLWQPGGLRLPIDTSGGVFWLAALAFVGALCAIAVAVRGKFLDADASRLLVCAAVVPPVLAFAVSLVLNVYAPRYLLFVVPSIALLFAAGVREIGNRSRGTARGVSTVAAAAGGLVAFLVLAANLAATVGFYRQPRLDVFDWRYVSRELAAAARADDAIVFLPGFSRIPIDYYFRGPQPRIPLSPEGSDVVGPRGARMPEIAASLGIHPRVWIVTVQPVPVAVSKLVESMRPRSFIVAHRARLGYVEFIRVERQQ